PRPRGARAGRSRRRPAPARSLWSWRSMRSSRHPPPGRCCAIHYDQCAPVQLDVKQFMFQRLDLDQGRRRPRVLGPRRGRAAGRSFGSGGRAPIDLSQCPAGGAVSQSPSFHLLRETRMTSMSSVLAQDHRLCDEIFAEAERAAGAGEYPAAQALFARFSDAMERHMRFEEETLFPAFDSATGNDAGPTAVMRHEHRALRELLGRMNDAIAQ